MATQSHLTGLTWGHKRAIAPLHAASEGYSGPRVDWQVRDLGRFEHEPLQVIAKDYDLLVFDHPFCGVIAASGCFKPLPESWIEATLEPDASQKFIGRSLASYRYGDRLWGLPVDGACNHSVYRADLLDRFGGVPQSWDEVVDLGQRARQAGQWLGIGALGHHGLLAAAALMANAGHAFPEGRRSDFRLDRAVLVDAIDAIRRVLDLSPPECLGWNSIALQDAMVARDDIVYCPIVYGFATYGEVGRRRRLGFGPLPGTRAPYHSGAVIGGAAVGISASCKDVEAALDYLAYLATAETQTHIFGQHSGQPGRIESWTNDALDARFGGYFSGTFTTMAACSMRPRFVGYQQFEKRAGDLMEAMLRRADTTADIATAVIAEAERVRAGDLVPQYLQLLEAL